MKKALGFKLCNCVGVCLCVEEERELERERGRVLAL